MESTRGQLLIAGPALVDPNFRRTVVLVVEHSAQGALGLVLNRPSESTVGEAVPELEGLIESEERMFIGGPVAPTGVIVLAQFADPDPAGLLSFDNVGLLRIDTSLEDPPAVVQARAFAGHSGWGPGQLDAELEQGGWILEPATGGDAFCQQPEQLWSEVLSRKGGSYALVARMPPDPSLN
ncbi:MAG TPA: YqgE/AlgH family protein [Solirubrobacteraceae bacterium]|nr:YqgE/AlgH family protein [Solirubrobacteraceae bacterium]